MGAGGVSHSPLFRKRKGNLKPKGEAEMRLANLTLSSVMSAGIHRSCALNAAKAKPIGARTLWTQGDRLAGAAIGFLGINKIGQRRWQSGAGEKHQVAVVQRKVFAIQELALPSSEPQAYTVRV